MTERRGGESRPGCSGITGAAGRLDRVSVSRPGTLGHCGRLAPRAVHHSNRHAMLIWFTESLGYSAAAVDFPLRAVLAACLALSVALAIGSLLIPWLRGRYGEPIKSASETVARLHSGKHGTPTMGGLFIVAALVASLLALGNLASPYIWMIMSTTVALAALGAVDDLAKLRGPTRGLSARAKLAGQIAIALVASLVLFQLRADVPGGHELWLPGGASLPLGWLAVPLAVLTITASSNAVNLTDGLDGLASGCAILAAAAWAALAYLASDVEVAAYLQIPYISGGGEMVVVATGLVGALLGFLWFNRHPARVFMGDTGSLPLGGVLGLIAVIIRQEVVWIIVGGVFVAEALSVVAQVTAFKAFGRRVLRCAPLHHHFEFLGWSERRIVIRFWLAAAVCAVVGLSGVGLGVRNENGRLPALPTIAAQLGVTR